MANLSKHKTSNMRIFTLFLFAILMYSCNNNKDNKRNDRKSDRESEDYRNNDREDKAPAKDKWSRADIADFNRDCEKNMSDIKEMTTRQMEDYCACLLEKFQDKYDSYDEMDKKSSYEEGKEVGDECKSALTGKKDYNSRSRETSAGWTERGRQQWMDQCTESVGDNMSSRNKQEYCSCILEKLELRYDNFDDMNTRGTQEEGVELGQQCLRKMGLK